jgi:hypothetical protein
MGNDIDNAMPWDKIDPTDYTFGTTILILIKPQIVRIELVLIQTSIN